MNRSISTSLRITGVEYTAWLEETVPPTVYALSNNGSPLQTTDPLTVALLAELLEERYPGYATFSEVDWRDDVVHNNTLLGYEDWVRHKTEERRQGRGLVC